MRFGRLRAISVTWRMQNLLQQKKTGNFISKQDEFLTIYDVSYSR
jgi:hypothetical protein